MYNSFDSYTEIIANNVTNNGEYGIYRVTNSNPSISFDNCWLQSTNYYGFAATPGPYEISVNPNYVAGPGGSKYLGAGSACINAGPTQIPTPNWNPVGTLTPTPFPFNLYTTSTSEMRDSNRLDIGVHYKMSSPTPVNTPHWTATPTPTDTPTPAATSTPTETPTLTPTPSPTDTPTTTPTGATETPTITPTSIALNGSLTQNFEDPYVPGSWETSGLWHLVSEDPSDPHYSTNGFGNSQSWSRSFWYGQELTGNYDTGGQNWGYIHTPQILLSGTGTNELRFWSWEEVESGTGYDSRSIYISNNGGASWYQWWTSGNNSSNWQEVSVDLSFFSGQEVIISFFFDSITGTDNNFRGWYVDDIEIISEDPPPIPSLSTTGLVIILLIMGMFLMLATLSISKNSGDIRIPDK